MYLSEPINLWEAITAARTNHDKDSKGQEPRCLGPRVVDSDVDGLSKSARWYGQELSVRATDEGWVITVFSCWDDRDECGIEILIPKDGKEPAKILKDRNHRIMFLHD